MLLDFIEMKGAHSGDNMSCIIHGTMCELDLVQSKVLYIIPWLNGLCELMSLCSSSQ